MAILQNQNVAFNYRGILNLDATTINTPLDATLRAVTDGMGTSSPLQLSTDQVGISRTVALSAGATNPRLFNEVYTINNSGAQTGTLTGIFLNATETALNGITHNLLDLQVGGVSKFRVSNLGRVFLGDYLFFNNANTCNIRSNIDGNIVLANSAVTGFGLLQLGGTTSSFPAIKRNGAAIDFRLADDSGYSEITAKVINAQSVGLMAEFRNTINTALLINNGSGSNSITLRVRNTADGLNRDFYMDTLNLYLQKTSLGSVSIGTDVINASAVFQIDSTTKGFLPPRMTTAQINAIATPAEGLVVYNTTISHLCVYQAGVWVRINHSPM